MDLVATALPYVQIVLALLLVGGILLQQRSASLGGAFGASAADEATYGTRRGAELFLFRTTIVIAVLFTLSALLALIVI